MDVGSLFPFAAPQSLRVAVSNLASLDEKELATVNEVLTQLDAPIDRRKIKTIGERVQQRTARLTNDEWENVVSLALQLISASDFMEYLDGFLTVDDKSRAGIKRVLDALGSNGSLKRAIAIDKVLERGPRLQHLSCFCDVRVHFADPGLGGAGATYVPREEFKVPMAIVRMKVDEIQPYIYFQLSATELEEHISTLQKACDQLRCLTERGRT
jgi:hypothetical protein